MRAVLSNEPGGPDTLALTDVPAPEAGPGEVVVDVEAVAVNYPDVLIIEDLYQFKPRRPFAPGAEVAGTVSSVGEGVTSPAVGDRVLAVPGFGGMVEQLAVKADACIPIPDSMPADDAAAFVMAYGTSHYALKDRAHARPGESLFVLGAAGGVGLAAVEIGKVMGARVIACASSDEKCEFAKQHGADETINYGREDLKESLKQLTGGRGVDVVYDPIGGDYAEPALRAVAWKGRFLVIGFAAGAIPKLPLNLVLLKGCDVVGVFWGAFTEREPAAHAANMADIVKWCAQGKLSLHVHSVYPLEQTAQAIKDIADRRIMGKAIIRI